MKIDRATVVGATAGLAIGAATLYFSPSFTNRTTVLKECAKDVSSQHAGPPKEVFEEVIKFLKDSPDEVFAKNSNYDIYSLLANRQGPFVDIKHRRAVMGDLILKSMAYESDYQWNRGRDMNASNTSLLTQEAGIVQTSCNILNFGNDLRDVMAVECREYPGTDCQKFIKCTKGNHRFAIEIHARALRKKGGYKHWGPIASGVVPAHTSKACVAEIAGQL